MKNPSEPSLIGSLTSYISLVPESLSKISQRIHILITMNANEMTKAAKAITLAVEEDTNN